MKLFFVSMGAGFVLFQLLLVIAIFRSAGKPTPEFEPPVSPKKSKPRKSEEMVLAA